MNTNKKQEMNITETTRKQHSTTLPIIIASGILGATITTIIIIFTTIFKGEMAWNDTIFHND